MIDLNIGGSDKHIIYDEYNRRRNTSPVLSSDVELLLQQIDILFDTTPREVFGHEEFGTTYDDYLYNLQISGESLADAVLNDLNTLDLLGSKAGQSKPSLVAALHFAIKLIILYNNKKSRRPYVRFKNSEWKHH